MDKSLFRWAYGLILKEYRSILLCTLFAAFFLLVFIRAKPFSFTARVLVYANSSTNVLDPMASTSALFKAGTGAEAIEKATFIMTQEGLVKSYTNFEFVKKRAGWNKKDVDGVSLRTLVSHSLQRLLFGSAYVSNRKRGQNPGYDSFIRRVNFSPNLTSGTFTLEFADQDPTKAVRILKHIVNGLQELNSNIENQQSMVVARFLGGKIEETKSNASIKAEAVAKFIIENNFSDSKEILDTRYKMFLSALEEQQKAKVEFEAQSELLERSRVNVRNLEREIKRGLASGAQGKIEALSMELRRYQNGSLMSGTDESGIAQQLEAKIRELRQSIAIESSSASAISDAGFQTMLQEAQKNVVVQEAMTRSLARKQLSLEETAKVYSQQIEQYPQLKVRLAFLMREQEQEAKILDALMQQYLVISIKSDAKINRLFVLEEPRIVKGNMLTNKLVQLIVGTGMALAAIVLVFMAIHILRGTIYSSDQLSQNKNGAASFVGAVPTVASLADAFKPSINDISLESTLRRLMRRGKGKKTVEDAQVVALTSAAEGSGKSVAALCLAGIGARTGQKVLIIDGDPRAVQRNITIYMNRAGSVESSMVGDLKVSTLNGVSFVELQTHGNPTGIATANYMLNLKTLLAIAKPHFDLIILDLPPITLAESSLGATAADTVVFCVKEGIGKMSDIQELEQRILEECESDVRIASLLTQAELSFNLGHLSHYQYATNYQKKAA
jgi:Mrp family chromosome partitioning ATPase/uncharacterized protein involved in exopolysaccharide biosynthesis